MTSATFAFVSSHYPDEPGCYLMRDRQGRLLYIGKAKNLRRRLGAYFRSSRQEGRLRQLVSRIATVEIMLVNNETESLILEHNLIRRHRPPFNRDYWRQQAGYPYIVLTDEPLPRFVGYRRRGRKGQTQPPVARRFGPYVSTSVRDALLAYVVDTFQLRTCQPLPEALCFRHDLGRCSGVCVGATTADAYQQAVGAATAFLSRSQAAWIAAMKRQMGAYARALEFERARWLRDRVVALERALEKQIVERDVDYDQDVIYFGGQDGLTMQVRSGCVLDFHAFRLPPGGDRVGYLTERYASASPRELIVNGVPGAGAVSATLSGSNGRRVRVIRPQRGVRRALLALCRHNYHYRQTRMPSEG